MNLHTEVREARKEKDAQRRAELSRENKDFAQVYAKGWRRLQSLIQTNPSAARLYALIAENMDPQGGAVVASQAVLAEMLESQTGQSDPDESTGGPAGNSADPRRCRNLCLRSDPDEIWKAWAVSKDHAVFRTRLLSAKPTKRTAP